MHNVTNAYAISEIWFSNSDPSQNFVVVNVLEGIGTGIFANGQILRGGNGIAGEFRHVQVSPGGLPCSCGGCGCWETLASNRAALHYYDELAPRRSGTTFDLLIKLGLSGDPLATEALTRVFVELGRGIRMIAPALDPDEIIEVGDITSAWSIFAPTIVNEMRGNSMLTGPVLRPSHNGDDARLRSAVALILNERLLEVVRFLLWEERRSGPPHTGRRMIDTAYA